MSSAILACLVAAITGFMYWQYYAIAFAVFVITISIKYKEFIIFFKCLPREVYLLWRISKMIFRVRKNEEKTLGELFSSVVRKHPNKLAIIDAASQKKLTFKEFEDLINKISNVFYENGFSKGDNVALFMENRIEYIAIYVGLSNIGVSSVFINTSLKGESLRNALKIKNLKGLIYSSHLENDILFEKSSSDKLLQMFVFGEAGNTNARQILGLIDKASSKPPVIDFEITSDFPVSYIFTSGTTGHPKAAIIIRKKFLMGFAIFNYLTEIHGDDVIYNTLPMSHTSGSIIFAAGLFLSGCTMVIRQKFSASHFLEDCIRYNVTYAGYIGEMMRYLMERPSCELDRQHRIKKVVGNGLRKSLFKEIKTRFGIPKIYEFYGATEANFGFINNDNTEGAVGFLFKCFTFLNLKRLVKVDRVTGELVRNISGKPIECQPGEVGTLIGLINRDQPYHGYTDKQASDKKVARDVYKKGDSYFMTGDLLTTDQLGYLYFVDRLGDTFRWKGENVSTTEVENIISSTFNSFIHCIVYPVEIPDHEGRAGMLYINDKTSIEEINEVLPKWKQNLPRFAIPIFARIGNSLSLTSTFKYQKEELKKQGIHLNNAVENEEFLVLKGHDIYQRLDTETYNEIMNGRIKF